MLSKLATRKKNMSDGLTSGSKQSDGLTSGRKSDGLTLGSKPKKISRNEKTFRSHSQFGRRIDLEEVNFVWGSDCAGMGSDLAALTLFGFREQIETSMWSDSDPDKRKLYRHVCSLLDLDVSPRVQRYVKEECRNSPIM